MTVLPNNKATTRSRFVNARSALGEQDRARASRTALGHLLDAPEIRAAKTVAAYASFGTEPDTGPLLSGLLERSIRVLLPVLRDDFDLDWVQIDRTQYSGPGDLPSGKRGLPEPSGPRLGVEAIKNADVV